MKTVKDFIEAGTFEDCGDANRRLKTPVSDLLLFTRPEIRELWSEDGVSFFNELMEAEPEAVAEEAEKQLPDVEFPFSLTYKGEEYPFNITRKDIEEAIEAVRRLVRENKI